MNDGDDQRTGLRIVFWMFFFLLLYMSVSPKTIPSRGPIHGPGYFYQYQDDPLMLLIGGAVVLAIALIGLRI